MKRFVVLFILSLVIVGALTYVMPKGLESYVQDISADATVSVYCRQTALDALDMGSGKIVQCSVTDLERVVARCKDVYAFSASFVGTTQDVERIVQLFNLKVTSTLSIDGLQVVCGNSAKLTGGVTLDGARVNLQIAYKDGTVTVGSPLILGDY